MTANDLCETVITAPDKAWLKTLCRELIGERLAASDHVVHPATSIYRWHDDSGGDRSSCFLRSRFAHLQAVVSYVVEQHPYYVPNVFPIADGNPSYLAWIRKQWS